MKDQQDIRKALLNKSNLLLVVGTYFFVATYLTIVIFDKDNLAAPDLLSKILLIFVVLLIVAPAFSIIALNFRLRLKHYRETKNFSEFLVPTKGTLGNPDLSELVGPKGQRVFGVFLKLLFAIVVFAFIGFPLWELLSFIIN